MPISSTRPASRVTIRSTLEIVERRWAMMRLVRSAMRDSRPACTHRSDLVSRAEVASSRTRIGASLSRALAIEMRCFWPPESLIPRSPTRVSYCWENRLMKRSA